MKILGITEEGMAFHATSMDAEKMVGCAPFGTDIAGVYCWSSGRGAVNDSVTTYLRSIGLLSHKQCVRGVALFGAVGINNGPKNMNECVLELLGWSITRSLIAAIEVEVSTRVA